MVLINTLLRQEIVHLLLVDFTATISINESKLTSKLRLLIHPTLRTVVQIVCHLLLSPKHL